MSNGNGGKKKRMARVECEEPHIVINGTTLTRTQAMVVRVAICSMEMDMTAPRALGADDTGLAIQRGYRERLEEILRIMRLR